MHAWTDRARRATLHTFSILLIVALGSGCGIFSPDESNDGGGGGTTVDFPTALTPDILVSNFEKSYENLNILEYEKVLHADFTFWFSPDDIADLGHTVFWGRAEDIESATNMFSGVTGSRDLPEGGKEEIPAILSFTMQLTQQEPWVDEFDDGAEFAPADFRSRYRVEMTVRYTDANRVTSVEGNQVFYVKSVPMEVDGQMQDVYQLFSWKDLGNLD